MLDLASRKIVRRVAFPHGSKPYMLRATPDGKHVWVLTGVTNETVVLDAATLRTVATIPTGRGPVEPSFAPSSGRYGLVAQLQETWVLAIDRTTLKPAAKIEVGGSQSNISFAPDGRHAFVTVTSANDVAVINMATLAVTDRIKTGGQPMGIVLV